MDLTALSTTHQATVRPDHLDEMGHMNVMWYVHLFDRATYAFFGSLGMDLTYFDSQKAGAFALEQHIRYVAEARLGDAVTIRSRALGRTAKRFHFMHFMNLDGSGDLAATTELVGIHMDMTVRRSTPMPGHIAAAFDALLAVHSRLGWAAPVCGVMGP